MFDELSDAIQSDLSGLIGPAAHRLQKRFNKKFRYDGDDKTRDRAIKDFMDNVKVARESKITLTADEISAAREFIRVTLESGVRALAREGLFGYDNTPFSFYRVTGISRLCVSAYPQQVMTNAIYSSPAFIGFGKGVSATSLNSHVIDKFNRGEYSCTLKCKPLSAYLRAYYEPLYQFLFGPEGTVHYVKGSRVITVPKNSETDRVITAEPSYNLAMQLAIGRFLEVSLRSIGLDIKTQAKKNIEYARLGSLWQNQFKDPFCTIDEKSASDFNTISLVELLFPEEFVAHLLMTRSECAYVEGHGLVDLPMISTMGNGFTFPLLTLISAALCYAANKGCTGGHLNWRHTAIFGDDIIVRRSVYKETVSVLVRAGLIINTAKSYSTGLFRESCGGDWYNGVFITPFYIKSLNNDSEICVAINQVLEWSSRTGVVLPRTLSLLRSALSQQPQLVPYAFSYAEGVLCPDAGYHENRVSYLDEVMEKSWLSHKSPFYTWAVLAGMVSRLDDKALEPKYLEAINTPKEKRTRVQREIIAKVGKGRVCNFTTRSSSTGTFIKKRKYYPFLWNTMPTDRDVCQDFWATPKHVPFGHVVDELQKQRWTLLVFQYIGIPKNKITLNRES